MSGVNERQMTSEDLEKEIFICKLNGTIPSYDELCKYLKKYTLLDTLRTYKKVDLLIVYGLLTIVTHIDRMSIEYVIEGHSSGLIEEIDDDIELFMKINPEAGLEWFVIELAEYEAEKIARAK